MASLEMVFYPVSRSSESSITLQNQHSTKIDFPPAFAGGAFAAEHGSWNRKNRAGYEVIFIPMIKGKATGEYDDFLTGFVTADGGVWGRPVGVTVGNDGSLFVSDDGTRSVWHVVYTGK
jgi:glucose/arabinose dehydrogenase